MTWPPDTFVLGGGFGITAKGEIVSEHKSILDGMRIKEEGFYKPVPVSQTNPMLEAFAPLIVVGACPGCGSPIYGKPSILLDENPQVRLTCSCRK